MLLRGSERYEACEDEEDLLKRYFKQETYSISKGNRKAPVPLFLFWILQTALRKRLISILFGRERIAFSANVSPFLDVDDEIVATDRVWREDWTEPYGPHEPVPFNFEGDVPGEEDPGEEEEDVIIPDELVPLAAAPQTGDLSTIYAAFAAVSGLALAGLSLTKKREED